ncbi:MAG: M28 family peptidase, partial [Gemmatimonadetes bacterium]|nr:M28 family peptidase [Gemmatimonadota bacterium]NIQ59035.1 M28 family peptidase [Gemmatimonadota bacterium]NIU79243.1 M28 family peptidase [Gammaproteobacteria bacterium]NIX48721.1 M28 family peptidase [Gemmatimonadota bacterium]NIY13172.1 M28 family peptidase [Gemmatimonadota bacterium]
AVDGDSIYNGAYDNASGVALLLEIAEAFAGLEEGTPRGTLFIATAAEEAGLLGARHYVRRPLFPLSRTAAVINVDGASLWGPTADIVAPGADRSTLGEPLRARAAEMGLEIVPDPDPGQGFFFRSDQFPFALAGVPAVHIRHGTAFRSPPQGWSAEALARWQDDHYHKPSDQYDPALDFSGAVQQGRLIFGVGWDVATADRAPDWLPDSPYRAARDRSP